MGRIEEKDEGVRERMRGRVGKEEEEMGEKQGKRLKEKNWDRGMGKEA